LGRIQWHGAQQSSSFCIPDHGIAIFSTRAKFQSVIGENPAHASEALPFEFLEELAGTRLYQSD
jgi:hypothetical protein